MRYSLVQGLCLLGLTTARPTETLDARGIGFKANANVFVINDYSSDITVVTTDNYFMSDTLPDSFVCPKAKGLPAKYVATSFLPLKQPSFNVGWKTPSGKQTRYAIKLGQTGKKTEVHAVAGNPEFESEAIFAPQKTLSTDVDWNLYLLGGTNMLASLINSVIGSMIGKLKFPISPKLPIDGVTLNIDSVPKTIKATYVGVANMAGAAWDANLVLNVDGDVTGSATVDFLKTTVPFKVNLGNFKALAKANIDIANAAGPQVKVSFLQTSMDTLDISSEAFDLIGKGFPIISKLFKVPKELCAAINTDFNGKVLALIQDALKGGLPALAKRDLEMIAEKL